MSWYFTSKEDKKKYQRNSFTLSLTSFFNTSALDNTQETYDYLFGDEYN